MTRYLILLLLVVGCIEQPKPHPVVRKPSLYARIGGYDKVEAIVEDFSKRQGNSVFKEERVKRRLIEHLSAALGGPWSGGPEELRRFLLDIDHQQGAAEIMRGLEQSIRATDLGERTLSEVLAALQPKTTR